MKKLNIAVLAAATAAFLPMVARAQTTGAYATEERLAQLANPVRVLFLAAHPDDEDTQLITWLARGRHVNTAYLSLNRGDGGQNLIGNELGEALGVIRTNELLAARRIDGAHQYFTRAFDFGFSKTATETYSHWPKDSVLEDVVTVIRAFRPQIIITTFSGTPRDGHGHHQVSALLAKEAYDSAAEDTVRYPVAKFGNPWRVLKLYRNARFSPTTATLTINVGEYNPELGESYAEIAAESRSQHKSQGFGSLKRKGVILDYLARVDSRAPAPADPKQEKSLFDGIDTTAVAVPADSARKARLAGQIAVEAVADRLAVAERENANVRVTLFNRGRTPVAVGCADASAPHTVMPDSSFSWQVSFTGLSRSQPWWLASPRNGDLFAPRINTQSEDVREATEAAHVSECIDGMRFDTPIVYHYADPVRGDVQRPLMVAPGVSVTLDRTTEIARAGAPLNRTLG
jgi:Uncharacterized proteins, LmbE homologs